MFPTTVQSDAQFTPPARHKTVLSVSCQAVWIESPPDRCDLCRSASGGRTGSACASGLVGRSGRLSSHRHTRHDKIVLSAMSAVPVWIGRLLWTCSETSNFPSATVLSYRQCNSHRRSGRDAAKTVVSCLAWRCEFALRYTSRDSSGSGTTK